MVIIIFLQQKALTSSICFVVNGPPNLSFPTPSLVGDSLSRNKGLPTYREPKLNSSFQCGMKRGQSRSLSLKVLLHNRNT